MKQNQNNHNSTKVVIEIDDLQSSQEFAKEDSYKCFLEDFKDESFTLEFLQLVELCLKYECSDGMTRILKKNLVPKFRMANRAFIESLQFQEILEKIITTMQRQPNLKFSCIKTVCEVLKENEVKKRVNFVTLDKNVSGTYMVIWLLKFLLCVFTYICKENNEDIKYLPTQSYKIKDFESYLILPTKFFQ